MRHPHAGDTLGPGERRENPAARSATALRAGRGGAAARRVTALCALAALVALPSPAPAADPIRVADAVAITVDGDVSDWKDVPIQYFDHGPRITAFARDEHFLYVQFRFSDPGLARMVLRSGAIVWVSPSGSHEPDYGVRYRGSAATEAALRAAEPPNDDASLDAAARPGPNAAQRGPERPPVGALEVLHLGVADEVILDGSRTDGPAAAAGVTDGVFAYELRIPAAEALPPAKAGGGRRPSRIAVGFQMNGLTAADGDAMQDRMHSPGRPGGGPPGGLGGGRAGGARGGFAGPSVGPGRAKGPERGRPGGETVWVDLEIAAAANGNASE